MVSSRRAAAVSAAVAIIVTLVLVSAREPSLDQWIPIGIVVSVLIAVASRDAEEALTVALGLLGAAVSSVLLFALVSEALYLPFSSLVLWSSVVLFVWGLLAPTWWYPAGIGFGWIASMYLAHEIGPTCQGDAACAIASLVVVIALILSALGVGIRKTIDYHRWRHPEQHLLWPGARRPPSPDPPHDPPRV